MIGFLPDWNHGSNNTFNGSVQDILNMSFKFATQILESESKYSHSLVALAKDILSENPYIIAKVIKGIHQVQNYNHDNYAHYTISDCAGKAFHFFVPIFGSFGTGFSYQIMVFDASEAKNRTVIWTGKEYVY